MGAVAQLGERYAGSVEVTGSKPVSSTIAGIAQSVEQGTENPCVGGSIPPPGTILNLTLKPISRKIELKKY